MELGLSDGVKRIILVVTLVVAVLCCAWRGKWTLDAYNDYKAQLASCEAAIIKTQTDIQAQKQDLNDVNTEKHEILANYHELGDVGIKVAALQTEWSKYVYQRSVCQKGDRGNYDQLIEETEQKMREYFAELPFGWYACRDDGVSWQCVTNYSFYTHTLRTVWLFQSADVNGISARTASSVYGYATADYSYDTRKFTNVDVRLSDRGISRGVDTSDISSVRNYDPTGFPVMLRSGSVRGSFGEVVLDVDEILEEVESADIQAIIEAGRDDGGNTGSGPDYNEVYDNDGSSASGTGGQADAGPGTDDVPQDTQSGDGGSGTGSEILFG